MNKTYHIQFYTRDGCHLCDEVRELLYRLRDRFPLMIQEIDITSDDALYERYRTIIPVVTIDGKFTLEARIEEKDICRYLQEGAERLYE